MRFLVNGPSIPNELLVARDEGRVVFFCGAGVSRALAGLPDFFGLAEKVIETLGVAADDPARRLIEEAQEIDRRIGISGIISADRIFGLLERSFLVRDIEAAVAKALKPSSQIDLSTHRIMLDLARAPDGEVRLVTTNFDLLFESCDSSLSHWRPPRLPDPRSLEEFEGIIHLHGHVDEDYGGAAGDGFVLSSSEFGRAYLSDGWATSFIKSVLDKYVVVFVGYTADDPPVQYLLEALNSYSGSLEGVYAFQVGSADEAEAKWRHKGAQAIAYDKADNHKALWDTLAAWAGRARDPDAWYDSVIVLARGGPKALSAHERGQIAHVVSTLNGARKFSASDEPPPAEWLCVFDPSIRYSKPGYFGGFRERETYFDPFEAYGMDSDLVPPKIDPKDPFERRDVPYGAWNCFALTRLDHQDLGDDDFATLKGHWSMNVPRLPPRLRYLGAWISKVSAQPATIWWASGQVGIHPDIQDQIRLELERLKTGFAEIRKAWRYIFEAWKIQKKDFHPDWYDLKASIDIDGWTNAAIREFSLINRPYLRVEKPCSYGPRPPENKENMRLDDLIHLSLEYPELDEKVQIPEEFLIVVVREFRKNLEYAVTLEGEIGGYGLHALSPIEPDPDLEGETHSRTFGESGYFLFYVDLLRGLIEENAIAARQEYLAWPADDETVFARLRIWAAGEPRLLSGAEAGRLLCRLDDKVFWDNYHQRDLLLVLARRWNDFSAAAKQRIERRLVRGRPQFKREEKGDYLKRRASLSLSRIHWLKAHGCKFTFNVKTESAALQEFVPEWKEEYAANVAASMEGSVGWVRIDKEFSVLLTEPLGTLISKAAELSGHTDMRSFVESDPFAGLASERPVRAFAALTNSARRNDYPEWAWRTFLNPEARKSDKPKFSALIAERISRLPTRAVVEFIRSTSEWLLQASEALFAHYPKHFEHIWAKLVMVLRCEPERAKPSVVRGSKGPDWAMEALNAPVGNLARVLMKDPTTQGLEVGKGFPIPWINRVEELLTLEGDLRRHALVMFTFKLDWFFGRDPVWTEKNLISVTTQEGDDQNAFWAGFFWSARVPDQKLYMKMKPHLLRFARLKSMDKSSHSQVLPGILLAGWGSIDQQTSERLVTSAEMREVLLNVDDNFRSQILWQLKGWSTHKEGDWEAKLPVFLSEVWPRHKKAKGPKICANLCDLAFSDAANFQKIVDIILPLVAKIDQEHIALHNLRKANSDIVGQFPEKTLALLFAVLPENASAWPYRIEDTLERIGVADPFLMHDGRLVELKRRWNAR